MKNPSRRERKKQETRQRLLQCSWRLFQERGCDDTTVEDITEAADVAKGTFFNYFSTKEAILDEIKRIQRSLGVTTIFVTHDQTEAMSMSDRIVVFMHGIIGDTHAKWAARDAGIPLFRIGFPIIDRVNLHRSPVIGYTGAINMLTMMANKFLDITDETCEDQWFEMMR